MRLMAGLGFIIAIGAVVGILTIGIVSFAVWTLSGWDVELLALACGPIFIMLGLGWFARRTFIQAYEAWNAGDDFFIETKQDKDMMTISRMRKIGIASAQPAEFIILLLGPSVRFSGFSGSLRSQVG